MACSIYMMSVRFVFLRMSFTWDGSLAAGRLIFVKVFLDVGDTLGWVFLCGLITTLLGGQQRKQSQSDPARETGRMMAWKGCSDNEGAQCRGSVTVSPFHLYYCCGGVSTVVVIRWMCCPSALTVFLERSKPSYDSVVCHHTYLWVIMSGPRVDLHTNNRDLVSSIATLFLAQKSGWLLV